MLRSEEDRVAEFKEAHDQRKESIRHALYTFVGFLRQHLADNSATRSFARLDG